MTSDPPPAPSPAPIPWAGSDQADKIRGGVLSLLLLSVKRGKGRRSRDEQESDQVSRQHVQGASALADMLLPLHAPQTAQSPPLYTGDGALDAGWPAKPMRVLRPRSLGFRDGSGGAPLPAPDGEVPGPSLPRFLETWNQIVNARQSYEATERAKWAATERYAHAPLGAASDQEVWNAARARVVRMLGPTLATPTAQTARVLQMHVGEDAEPAEATDARMQVLLVPRSKYTSTRVSQADHIDAEARAFDVDAYVAHVATLKSGDEVQVLLDMPAISVSGAGGDRSLSPLTGSLQVVNVDGSARVALQKSARVLVPALYGSSEMDELRIIDVKAPWRSGVFIFGKAWSGPLFSRRTALLRAALTRIRLSSTSLTDVWWPTSPVVSIPSGVPVTALADLWEASGLLHAARGMCADAWARALVEHNCSMPPSPVLTPQTRVSSQSDAAPADHVITYAVTGHAELLAALGARAALSATASLDHAFLQRSKSDLTHELESLQADVDQYAEAPDAECAPNDAGVIGWYEAVMRATLFGARHHPDLNAEALIMQGWSAHSRVEARQGAPARVMAIQDVCVEKSGTRGRVLRRAMDCLKAALVPAATLDGKHDALNTWIAWINARMRAPAVASRVMTGRRAQQTNAINDVEGENETLNLALGYDDLVHYGHMRDASPLYGGPAASTGASGAGLEHADGGPSAAQLLAALLDALATTSGTAIDPTFLEGPRPDVLTRILARQRVLDATEEDARIAALRARILEIKKRRPQLQARVNKHGADYDAFEARMLAVLRSSSIAARVPHALVTLCGLLVLELQIDGNMTGGGRGQKRAGEREVLKKQPMVDVMSRAANVVLDAFMSSHVAPAVGSRPAARRREGPPATAGIKARPSAQALVGMIADAHTRASAMFSARPARAAFSVSSRSDMAKTTTGPPAWHRFRPLGVFQPLLHARAQQHRVNVVQRLVEALYGAIESRPGLILSFNRRPSRYVVNACCPYALRADLDAWDSLLQETPRLRAALDAVRADSRRPLGDPSAAAIAATLPPATRLPYVRDSVSRVAAASPPSAHIEQPGAQQLWVQDAVRGSATSSIQDALQPVSLLLEHVDPDGRFSTLLGRLSAPSSMTPGGVGTVNARAKAKSQTRALHQNGRQGPSMQAFPQLPPCNHACGELLKAVRERLGLRPGQLPGWRALMASLHLEPGTGQSAAVARHDVAAPWSQTVTITAAWLRGDVAVVCQLLGGRGGPAVHHALERALPSNLAAVARKTQEMMLQSKDVIRDASHVLSLRVASAARGLAAVAAALLGAAGGVPGAEEAHVRVSELAGACGLGAMNCMLRWGDPMTPNAAQAEEDVRVTDAMHALVTALLGSWSARLRFGRDDLRDMDKARVNDLREEEKMRKMGVARRLDETGRDLVREMKKVRRGGVDWDAVERDLADAGKEPPPPPSRAAGAVEDIIVNDEDDDATHRDVDGMDAFWS